MLTISSVALKAFISMFFVFHNSTGTASLLVMNIIVDALATGVFERFSSTPVSGFTPSIFMVDAVTTAFRCGAHTLVVTAALVPKTIHDILELFAFTIAVEGLGKVGTGQLRI